jgi:hypothetical protein
VRLSGWRCRLANRSVMNSTRISYATRADTSPEEERNTLKNVYKLVIDSAKRNAAGMTSTNSTSVGYTEGVGDVERQPD